MIRTPDRSSGVANLQIYLCHSTLCLSSCSFLFILYIYIYIYIYFVWGYGTPTKLFRFVAEGLKAPCTGCEKGDEMKSKKEAKG